MPHPKETKRLRGRLWHLEDSGLTLTEAKVLKKHLVNTENKRARIAKTKDGRQVWWSR